MLGVSRDLGRTIASYLPISLCRGHAPDVGHPQSAAIERLSWLSGAVGCGRSVQSAAHHNSQAAAIRCAAFLRDWLGPRIFAGRLSLPQQQIMQQFVPTSIVYTNKACFVADAVKPKGLQ